MSTFYAFHSGSPLKCRVLEGVVEMDYHMYEPGRYVTVVTFSKKKKSMKAVLSELKEMSDVYGTGQIAKVKKADGKNMRVVHVMQGIRSAACVSEYAHHCWQVKDKEPLSEAEKDHRFKELVYWYMESFSSENSDHEKGWVVVLGHPRFGGAWYVGSFPEVDLLGKKQSVETCLERLNKEFSTEFEVVLKREDYNRFSARYVMLGWLHLDNDDKLDCGDQVRVKPVEGGEKNMFAAANKEWLQKLGVRMDKVDEPVDACIDAEMDKVDKPVDAGMKVVDTEEKVEVIELD